MPTKEDQILLILNGQIVQSPDAVQTLVARLEAAGDVHRQVLDRVTGGMAKLPANTYSLIHVAPEVEGQPLRLDAKTLDAFANSLAPSGRLEGALDFKNQKMDAIMAGLIESGESYVKPAGQTAQTSIPRRSTAATTNGSAKKMPIFKKLQPQQPPTDSRKRDSAASGIVKLSLADLDDDDDDDLVDENSLVAGSISTPIIVPPQCQPTNGKKRRKACKDCTCGLKELELQEEEAQRAKQGDVVTLNLEEEIDFTVPGKTGGSCGSCALGDAFRCDGCPYLGLPPFKPGEIVNIGAMKDDF